MISFQDIAAGWESVWGLPLVLLLALALSLAGFLYFLRWLRQEESRRLQEWAEERILPPLKELEELAATLKNESDQLCRIQQESHSEVCELLRRQAGLLRELDNQIKTLPDQVRAKMAASSKTAETAQRGAHPAPDELRQPSSAASRSPTAAPAREGGSGEPGASVRPAAHRLSLPDLFRRHPIIQISLLTDELVETVVKVRSDMDVRRIQQPFAEYRKLAARFRRMSAAGDFGDPGDAEWKSFADYLHDLQEKLVEIDFLELLELSAGLPGSEPRRGKLLEALGLEELRPEAGASVTDSSLYEIENVESSGSHKVIEQVVRTGFRKLDSGEVLLKPRVRIKIDSQPDSPGLGEL